MGNNTGIVLRRVISGGPDDKVVGDKKGYRIFTPLYVRNTIYVLLIITCSVMCTYMRCTEGEFAVLCAKKFRVDSNGGIISIICLYAYGFFFLLAKNQSFDDAV